MDEITTPNVLKQIQRLSKVQQGLADFFNNPVNQNRIVTPKDYYTRQAKTKQWFNQRIGHLLFSQIALELNQNAPIEVKSYYESMMNKSLTKFNSRTTVETIQNVIAGGVKKVTVTSDKIVKSVINAKGKVSPDPVAKVETQMPQRTTELVTEAEARLKRIRDEYIMAPIGDTPNIGDIAHKHGCPHQVDQIRKTAHEENWRAERANYLHQSLDLVPEEVKLVTMLRTVEVHKMLYQHLKVLHRQHMQYYQSGRVISMDGMMDLKFRPDPGSISALAETMRRIVDGSSSVNILINNQAKSTSLGGSGDLALPASGGQDGATLLTKKYINQIGKMSPDELEQEIDNLTKLRELVEEKTVIDVEVLPS